MIEVLKHEFVEVIPQQLQPGVVYVSVDYATAIHLCPCGCGSEIVTPLAPSEWSVTFDGETVSLNPSIGNWSYPCRSHYWIRKGEIVWAETWTDKEIAYNRKYGRSKRKWYRSWWPMHD